MKYVITVGIVAFIWFLVYFLVELIRNIRYTKYKTIIYEIGRLLWADAENRDFSQEIKKMQSDYIYIGRISYINSPENYYDLQCVKLQDYIIHSDGDKFELYMMKPGVDLTQIKLSDLSLEKDAFFMILHTGADSNPVILSGSINQYEDCSDEYKRYIIKLGNYLECMNKTHITILHHIYFEDSYQ